MTTLRLLRANTTRRWAKLGAPLLIGSFAAQPGSPVADFLNAPVYEQTLSEHRQLAGTPTTGDPHALILRLDWFSSPQILQFCSVTTDGRVAWGLKTWRSIKLRGRKQLDGPEFNSLGQAIAELPATPAQPNPERWLLVSGVRDKDWSTSIYDRRDIPPEVERLFEITGAPVRWDVHKLRSSAKTSATLDIRLPDYTFRTTANAHTWKPKGEWTFPELVEYRLAFAWDGTLLALLANGELHSLTAAALHPPPATRPQ